MASRFRFLHRPLTVKPHYADLLIKAAVVLHNFLRREMGVQYINARTPDHEDASGQLHPGEWRRESGDIPFVPITPTGRRNSSEPTITRDQFKEYSLSEAGSVPWQTDAIQRTT